MCVFVGLAKTGYLYAVPVYDDIFGDIAAIHIVYAPYLFIVRTVYAPYLFIYMVMANPVYKR
jgi:hypothetical protein